MIALPVELNYEVSKAALAKGKHIIMEKPIAHNLEDAQRIVALGKEYPRLVLMVAEVCLCYPFCLVFPSPVLTPS